MKFRRLLPFSTSLRLRIHFSPWSIQPSRLLRSNGLSSSESSRAALDFEERFYRNQLWQTRQDTPKSFGTSYFQLQSLQSVNSQVKRPQNKFRLPNQPLINENGPISICNYGPAPSYSGRDGAHCAPQDSFECQICCRSCTFMLYHKLADPSRFVLVTSVPVKTFRLSKPKFVPIESSHAKWNGK